MRKQDRILQEQGQPPQGQKAEPGSNGPVKAPSRGDQVKDVPRQAGKLPLPD